MGRARWSVLPPRPIPWSMKPFSSARTWESILPDGRVELRIDHDVIHGVTPQMLVWWFRNIEGKMELGGKTYPRYLVWHPIDHIHYKVETRLPDGSVGAGSRFHIVEAFGGDLRYLVDRVLHVRRLDETEIVLEVPALGRAGMRLHGQFGPVAGGTQLNTTMTVGLAAWIGRAGLNRLVRERIFPAGMRAAWLKHNVEEWGNIEFFLPDLYQRPVPSG
ncbi:MAG: hypothetical protein HY726_04895 [Candidatus Rokubacteria bacterium]|nr:hypothetical protein [Candidatus Rokubacteria bacterium]